MAMGEEQQVRGETFVAPAVEASPSPDPNLGPQVSTYGSGLFLRRGSKKIVLGQGELLNDLEEFEVLPPEEVKEGVGE